MKYTCYKDGRNIWGQQAGSEPVKPCWFYINSTLPSARSRDTEDCHGTFMRSSVSPKGTSREAPREDGQWVLDEASPPLTRVCVCVCAHAPSSLTLCPSVDCSPPGSSVHGISQAGILEWVAISFSKGSSQPRDQTRVSCTAGRFFTNWATREALFVSLLSNIMFPFVIEPII